MLTFLLRRVTEIVPLLAVISIMLFCVLQLPPGGPETIYANDPAVTAEDIARIKGNLGLDRPLPLQYLSWLRQLVLLDLGTSYREHRPVLRIVSERIWPTTKLMLAAFAFAIIGATLIGLYTAIHPRAKSRWTVNAATMLGISLPTFWTGLMVQLVLAAWLNVIPAGGMYNIGEPFSVLDRLHHLLAPAVILGSVYLAAWSRYIHSSFLNVFQEDYIRTARAKGMPEPSVIMKHALVNGLLPIITILGLEVPRLFTGAMVTEVVFAWPGMGRLVTDSLLARDYPVAMGILIIMAVMVVLGNLVADILYAVVDPRIRI